MSDLNAALLDAHKRRDAPALVTLYAAAGYKYLDKAETDAGCFYLTHAYVFALEAGDARAGEIHSVLKSYGREA